jgi:hypothetical protein
MKFKTRDHWLEIKIGKIKIINFKIRWFQWTTFHFENRQWMTLRVQIVRNRLEGETQRRLPLWVASGASHAVDSADYTDDDEPLQRDASVHVSPGTRRLGSHLLFSPVHSSSGGTLWLRRALSVLDEGPNNSSRKREMKTGDFQSRVVGFRLTNAGSLSE